MICWIFNFGQTQKMSDIFLKHFQCDFIKVASWIRGKEIFTYVNINIKPESSPHCPRVEVKWKCYFFECLVVSPRIKSRPSTKSEIHVCFKEIKKKILVNQQRPLVRPLVKLSSTNYSCVSVRSSTPTAGASLALGPKPDRRRAPTAARTSSSPSSCSSQWRRSLPALPTTRCTWWCCGRLARQHDLKNLCCRLRLTSIYSQLGGLRGEVLRNRDPVFTDESFR